LRGRSIGNREPFLLEADMSRHLTIWAFGVVWVLVVGGVAAMYMANQIAVGTLAFLEACAVVLAAVVAYFWVAAGQPEPSVSELLYDTGQGGPTDSSGQGTRP
jgi:hypothetical protein